MISRGNCWFLEQGADRSTEQLLRWIAHKKMFTCDKESRREEKYNLKITVEEKTSDLPKSIHDSLTS